MSDNKPNCLGENENKHIWPSEYYNTQNCLPEYSQYTKPLVYQFV